ncbi:MAG: pyridoxamine 5'-phosphate oxidase family protein [Chloroflexi bacterium]|nr:pyridoxamine 5'-phosphate oxidase family protein [Chloroflexota bacterium]
MGTIPQQLLPAMQGAVPSALATCSGDGEPNVAWICQTYYVDESHVALTRQFFNKTIRNMSENPRVQISVVNPPTGEDWIMDAEFVRSETESELFENMAMQLEAIATREGMTGVYRLLSADVCEVSCATPCKR